MAYDVELADRIRDLVTGRAGVSEKRMFGGIAFLLDGNMAIAASSQGGLLVCVDPAETDTILDSTGAEVAVMRGRPMQGWLRVAAADVTTDDRLGEWVDRSTDYAASLPPK
ncbi:MAG TPA: TfoX/Sxy family protein [Actinomycetes bacterium]|nr:TfoX/Sxy family protein [Actinomycetes bacterium]